MGGTTDHEVVIAGAGSTGLMLAAELALAGTDVAVVERRATQDLDEPRARGLHARTLEVLDQRGVAERVIDEGQLHPAVGYAQIPLDVTDLPTRHNHLLALVQRDIERILAGWADELGVPVQRQRQVVGLTQDDDGVDVELSGGAALRAAYLVGCDGGRSTVRKAAGIGFPGLDASTSWITAEVRTRHRPELGLRPEGGGIGPADPSGDGGPYQVVLKEPQVVDGDDASLDDLRAALVAAYGTDFGVHDPAWISRFSDMSRQADAYRRGRVLVAGDAAHVHPPQGGQGLNVGVQDAANLGWKLALVVAGHAPDALLDSYHAERHPVAARVLRNTMAQVALTTADERHRALHGAMAELLAMDEPRRHVAAMITGLDVHYDLGGGHPLVGRRLPDLDLHTEAGPVRAYSLLHEARGVLLVLDGAGGPDLVPWAGRVRHVAARAAGPWDLPVLGPVPSPPAVLVRPDGHVAWVGQPDDPALPAALTTWFGPGARA